MLRHGRGVDNYVGDSETPTAPTSIYKTMNPTASGWGLDALLWRRRHNSKVYIETQAYATRTRGGAVVSLRGQSVRACARLVRVDVHGRWRSSLTPIHPRTAEACYDI